MLTLLAAFSELPPEARLLVVGDGDGRPRVEEEMARLGIADRVRLVGAVSHEEMLSFYAARDFYAFPYAADRPFVAIGEAQAAGRPVVAMRRPSTQAVVADRQSGLLADDLDEFVTHMTTLASDRRKCASMGQTARDYVAAHHSIEVRIRQIEALLRRTAGEGLLPRPVAESV